MEETAKKAKAPAKPRKSAAKKTTPSNVTEMAAPVKGAALSNGAAHAAISASKASHEQVAVLAHRYWAERGYRHGHDAEDWFRAEQELLRGKAS